VHRQPEEPDVRYETLALARYSKSFAVASALALTVVGSVALFVTIQSLSPYTGFLQGHFYTPVPNSTETLFDRAFSRTGLLLVRLALWPSLVFVALQAGATYAISTLLPFEGRFVVTRRLIAGAGASALMSALVLAAMWSVLFGMISTDPVLAEHRHSVKGPRVNLRYRLLTSFL